MARWTAVQDRLTFGSGTEEAERITDVRALLGLASAVPDAKIAFQLNSAMESADEFLNNPFQERDWDEDSADFGSYLDPAVELPIPSAVASGVLGLIELGLTGRIRSVTSISAGQWSKSYHGNPELLRAEIQNEYFGRYRLTPGF